MVTRYIKVYPYLQSLVMCDNTLKMTEIEATKGYDNFSNSSNSTNSYTHIYIYIYIYIYIKKMMVMRGNAL